MVGGSPLCSVQVLQAGKEGLFAACQRDAAHMLFIHFDLYAASSEWKFLSGPHSNPEFSHRVAFAG